MTDVRKILADFQNGVAGMQEANPAAVQAFMGLQDATFGDSAISNKTSVLHRRPRLQCVSGRVYETGDSRCGDGGYRRLRRRPEYGIFRNSSFRCSQ